MNQENIQKLQFLEQNLQAILMQKQAFEMELNETISAMNEIEKSSEPVYKILGQIMIKISKENIIEELKGKEKLIVARIKTLDSQEETLKSQLDKIRNEIIGSKKE